MGQVQVLLCPPTEDDRKELRAYSNIGEDALRLTHRKRKDTIQAKERTLSHYEIIVHPNEEVDLDDSRLSILEEQSDQAASWAKSEFVQWFAVFDEEKLRPFFIRNYNPAKATLEEQYQELIEVKFDD